MALDWSEQKKTTPTFDLTLEMRMYEIDISVCRIFIQTVLNTRKILKYVFNFNISFIRLVHKELNVDPNFKVWT